MTLPGSVDKQRRRLKFFRRVGLRSAKSADISVVRATNLEDLVGAYGLVHQTFVEQGFIPPEEGGLRIRPFEALPEMATFVAKLEGRIVAVMSIVPDSQELGLPGDHAFRAELDCLRAEGRRICEVTNDVVAKEHRTGTFFIQLTRACFAHAQSIGCDDVFACVNPQHACFFESVLLFEPCGNRRSYSGAPGDLVEGKRLSLQGLEERAIEMDRMLGADAFLRDYYYTANPYHARVRAWAKVARNAFADPEMLRELFVRRSRLPERCSPEELAAIRKRWGPELFEEVFGSACAATAVA